MLIQSEGPQTLPMHVLEGDPGHQPWAVSYTCKNNHSETPAGVSQDASPENYVPIAEGVLAVIPREDSREFI